MKHRLIVFLTFLGGLYYFLEFVTPRFLPVSVPSEYRFGQVAVKHGGARVSDEVANFNTVAAAAGACRELEIDIEPPDFLAERSAAVSWTRTGTMIGRVGVTLSAPARAGDPAEVPGWTLTPAYCVRDYKTFESVQEFRRSCRELGGEEAESEAFSFRFDTAARAVRAARRVGVDIRPPDEALENPAVLTRFKDGRLEARVECPEVAAADSVPDWTLQDSRWSREYPAHPYFMLGGYHETITDAFIVIWVAAIGLGVINVLRAHGMRTVMRRKGWIYSAALLASMAAMMFAGFYDWRNDVKSSEAERLKAQALAAAGVEAVEAWEADPAGPRPEPSNFRDLADVDPARNAVIESKLPSGFARNVALFYKEVLMGLNGLFTGLSSAIFSLLALYIAAAAYRAFRIKSGEAALMMITALLVMLGQIPMGTAMCDPLFRMLGVDGGIAPVRGWIMEVINAAAFRGIFFGASIAGLAMGIRMWLSMETGSFYKE